MATRDYKVRSTFREYVYILLGAGITALALKTIYDPNELVCGGFTGAAIIIKSLSTGLVKGGIPLWFTNIALNLPFFLWAYKLLGFQFIKKTGFATLAMTGWLYIIPDYAIISDNLLLAAIFGGIMTGFGMGLVFLCDATTGGTDMVGAILKYFRPHISLAKGMMIFDCFIVCAGLYVFGTEPTLYAIISVITINKVADRLIDGCRDAKNVFIITERHKEVSDSVMKEINRGMTGLYAKGMYSGDDKLVLCCVCDKKEVVKVKNCIAAIDPGAFVIVSDANEAMGIGFNPVK